MLIEFKFKNFRSFRDEQSFSMEATATKVKENNVLTIDHGEDAQLRLLKSVAIYGANASGKTGFIRALAAFRWFITTRDIKATDEIACYEPFELGDQFEQKPIEFAITFIRNQIKYNYQVKFSRYEVIEERLEFYPSTKKAVLFERIGDSGEYHQVILGKFLKNKRIGKTSFKNQLYLSRFGSIEPHEHLTDIWRYFNDIEISTGVDRANIVHLSQRIASELAKDDNANFAVMLSWLMKKTDDHIKKLVAKPLREDELELPSHISPELKEIYIERYGKKAVTTHQYWSGGKPGGEIEFEMLDRESTGTNIVFALGGLIMLAIQRGGVLIADEFNSGLHPQISRFLIGLFHNKEINTSNAQIIFNTHESTLLDKDNFRSDQIWFVQKHEQGDSELYSAQDFDGVREDIPFEKWYLAGKFAAVPTLIPNDYSGLYEAK